MAEQIITSDDLQYLALESSNNLNLILAGMTLLMEENTDRLGIIENQTWFQRMSKTISGKNKMTQQEIMRNHDKINLYVTQALGELYNRNCIDHQLILSLGNRINELYESQVEIKQLIGAFAQKLNQKIESIDNYHMLITEINQGLYTERNSVFVVISKIMSQLDLRTVQDQRKMEILVRALEEQNILDRKEINFSKMLEELLYLSENEAGVLALFFGNMRNEYIAEIAELTLYKYYMLPEKVRRMKSRKAIVQSILTENDIDAEYSVSSYEMSEILIDAYKMYIVEAELTKQRDFLEDKRRKVKEYIDHIKDLLALINSINYGEWNFRNGELNTINGRKEYSLYIENIIQNLDEKSYIGNLLYTNITNMNLLAQRILHKFPDIEYANEFYEEESSYLFRKATAETFGLSLPEREVSKCNSNFQLVSSLRKDTNLSILESFSKSWGNEFWNEVSAGQRRCDAVKFENFNKYMTSFPNTTLFEQGYWNENLDRLLKVFNSFFNEVEKRLIDEDLLEEIYLLRERYPIEENSNLRDVFIREPFDSTQPLIKITYGNGKKRKYVYNYLEFVYGLNSYSTNVIVLKFENLPIETYTVSYEIIKNSYYDTSNHREYKYIDVSFGEWQGENELELILKKNHDGDIGPLEMKIYIKEYPSVVAYIKVY